MDVTLLTWAAVIGLITALIVVDLLTVSRKPHDVMFKEAQFGRFSISESPSHLVFGSGRAPDRSLVLSTLLHTS